MRSKTKSHTEHDLQYFDSNNLSKNNLDQLMEPNLNLTLASSLHSQTQTTLNVVCD